MKKKRKTFRNLILLLVLLLLMFGAYLLYTRVFPMEHEGLVENYAEEYQVDPYLVHALIHTESRYQEDAVSPAGAMGLMQITEDTGQFIAKRLNLTDFKTEDLLDPETNIRMGIYYLSYLEESFPLKETRLAAYNAGPNRVKEWLQDESLSDGEVLTDIPFEETRNYVERVTFREKIYRILYFFKG